MQPKVACHVNVAMIMRMKLFLFFLLLMVLMLLFTCRANLETKVLCSELTVLEA